MLAAVSFDLVAEASGSRMLNASSRYVGGTFPLHASATGKVILAELEDNAIVGEIAILCDVSRTATVRAAGPLEALRIRKDDFLKLLADYPDMMFEILRSLAQRLTRTTAELTEARAQIKNAT